MKILLKLIAYITIFTLFLSVASAGYEKKKDYVDSSYKAVQYSEKLNFSAERDGYNINLKWNKYQGTDFQYYKIMWSATHENPVYPDQPALRYLWDSSNESFELKSWSQKPVYYRICVITKDKNRICSNVVKIAWYEHKKEAFKKSEEYKEKYKEKKQEYVEKTKKLQKKIELKVDKVVINLVKKIKNKYPENIEKQQKVIEWIVVKLEKHPAKKEQTKLLIAYLIKKLNEAKDSLSSAEVEMQEVFKLLEQ